MPETPGTSGEPRTPAPRSTQATSAEETGTTKEPAGTDAPDDGVPAWVWWLVAGVLVVAIVLVVLLLTRTRRRAQWKEQLEGAGMDVAWLAREFLPQLIRTGSQERVAGGWQVGLTRVAGLEDQLTVLEASAPAKADGARARALRDAVRTARGRVDAVTAGGPIDTWALEIGEAIAVLEAAMTPNAEPRR